MNNNKLKIYLAGTVTETEYRKYTTNIYSDEFDLFDPIEEFENQKNNLNSHYIVDSEKLEIEKNLQQDGFNLSNLEKSIELALQYSLQLPSLWSSGDLEVKKSIQNMVFPDGILYDFKNDNYRTTRVNSIFSVIPSLSIINNDKKNGSNTDFSDYSRLVPEAGIEPARPKAIGF